MAVAAIGAGRDVGRATGRVVTYVIGHTRRRGWQTFPCRCNGILTHWPVWHAPLSPGPRRERHDRRGDDRCGTLRLSMPIEYSPKVPTENSSLRYGSIAAVATRRLDIGEDIKIEIGDGVQGLGSGAVAEAVWQGVAPGGVFGL